MEGEKRDILLDCYLMCFQPSVQYISACKIEIGYGSGDEATPSIMCTKLHVLSKYLHPLVHVAKSKLKVNLYVPSRIVVFWCSRDSAWPW